MKLSLKTTFVAMLVALALLIQGMPSWQPPAIAAEKPKSSPAAPKAGPMEMPAPPTVTEVPKDFPVDIVKGDDIEGLPEPPTEPLTHPPFPIPQVDPSNPESVALDKAQRTGEKVEILSARTETQTTFANPQGTLTTELSAGPIRIRRGDGFVPIDTTLEVLGGAVVPKAAQGQIEISNGGAAGSQLAALGSAGKRLSFNWPAALPTPVLKGNTATYVEVAPGQDLVVKATPSGFQTFVVLKTRPEQPVVITIPLGLDGLSLEKDDVSGELKFSNAQGELEISSSTPMMWSAARDPKGQRAHPGPQGRHSG